jgi:2-iminobutanoate/2-iminopropanoate deaminase
VSMAEPRHRFVQGEKLPRPVGPYSPATIYEGLIFVSGQGAADPATGKLVGLDIESQTDRALGNIKNILEAAGSRLDCVLRCGVFLVDMRDFQAMNTVYQRVFGDHRPARTTVGVAGLPAQGLRVEIDAVAYVPEK